VRKEQKELVRRLQDAGFETRTTRSQHLLVLRDGRVVTCFAGTPSDHRSVRNSLAPLRRLGFHA